MTCKINTPEHFSRPPDAVLLDMDNTLYPYDPAHNAAIKAIRQKATQTLGLGNGKFDEAFTAARADVKRRLQGTAASHSRLLYFQRMLEIVGLGSQVMLALDLEQTYWRTFLNNAVLFDGVKEFLDDLRLAGIPVAIVTDLTAQIQFRKILYFGLDHYVDYIVTSEEAGHDKPHRAPFEIALEKLRTNGKRIWFIGDDPVSDICGAKECLDAVTLRKVHNGSQRDGAQADLMFEDFQSLRKYCASIPRA